MELFFIRLARKFIGQGWRIGFTSHVGAYPWIEYSCAYCKNVTGTQAWVSGPRGFKGIAPVPTCCKRAVPYPLDNEKFVAHLHALPKYLPDAGTPVRFRDTNEFGSTGEANYYTDDPGF